MAEDRLKSAAAGSTPATGHHAAFDIVGLTANPTEPRSGEPQTEAAPPDRAGSEPESEYLSAREQRRLACTCGCTLIRHHELGCDAHGPHAFHRVSEAAAEEARRAARVPDPLSPQWEACKVCGGDHWTKDHPA